jgi:hypothetical protein
MSAVLRLAQLSTPSAALSSSIPAVVVRGAAAYAGKRPERPATEPADPSQKTQKLKFNTGASQPAPAEEAAKQAPAHPNYAPIKSGSVRKQGMQSFFF